MASTGMPLCTTGWHLSSLRIFLLKVKSRITFLVQRICPFAWWPCVRFLSNHGGSFLGVFPPLRVVHLHNVTIVRVIGTHSDYRSLLTLRSFNPSFVSEFTMFDHFRDWKSFLYLMVSFSPRLFSPAHCVHVLEKKRVICDVHNASQVGWEVNKMNRKFFLLFSLCLWLFSPSFLLKSYLTT